MAGPSAEHTPTCAARTRRRGRHGLGRHDRLLPDGHALRSRPERYRVAIERLTRQDVAVFFQEMLDAVPQHVAGRSREGRVVDIRRATKERFGAWLAAAGLPAPTTLDLLSGATALMVERPA